MATRRYSGPNVREHRKKKGQSTSDTTPKPKRKDDTGTETGRKTT
ncbi:hypothetical protein [Streptomyces sp. NPDC002851]